MPRDLGKAATVQCLLHDCPHKEAQCLVNGDNSLDDSDGAGSLQKDKVEMGVPGRETCFSNTPVVERCMDSQSMGPSAFLWKLQLLFSPHSFIKRCDEGWPIPLQLLQ